MSHTIKHSYHRGPLPRKICLIIKNCWTQNYDEFKMVFIFRFQAVKARIQFYRKPLHQQTLHYEEILGGSYINRLHLNTGYLKY